MASRFPKLLILPLALLCACGDEPVAGGSGTDAGNALTVTARAADGLPVAGATVELWPASQVPGAQGTAPRFAGTTAQDGRASFAVDTGSWSVLVRRGGAAFRMLARRGTPVEDTLRPMAKLTGIVANATGGRIALPGLGRSVAYGADGRFVLDSLPSGPVDYVVFEGATLIEGSASLGAGAVSELVVPAGTSLGADTIEPTYLATLPLSLGGNALLDTGSFAVAFSMERATTLGTSWLFGWTSPSGKGLRLGCAGAGTLLLEVDGALRRIEGLPLDAAPLQMGIGWDGKALEVRLYGELLLSLTTAALANRTGWTDPVIAPSGVSTLGHLALKTGAADSAWFASQLR